MYLTLFMFTLNGAGIQLSPVADPGFPVGGGGGSANSRGSYVSKSLYVKMKESGPLGGRVLVMPPWIHQ